MKRKTQIVISGMLLASAVVAGHFPAKERLSEPKSALLRSDSTNKFPVRLNVVWWDLGLNKERFSASIEFDESGRAMVPSAEVPTHLWKIGLKRVLSRFDRWTACEHCDGPWVDVSLQLKGKFPTPEGTRLAQDRIEDETNLIFDLSIVPDETKFKTREFRVRDHAKLVAEAKLLITKGPQSRVPTSDFGPELRAIDPVRAECKDSSVVLWMGGTLGYAIVPDSDSCPAMNRVMISGTSYPGIFKLNKIN